MKNRFPTIWHFLGIFVLAQLFAIPGAIIKLIPGVPNSVSFFFIYLSSLGITVWAVRGIFTLKTKFNFKIKYLDLFPLVIVTSFAFLFIGGYVTELLPPPSGWFKKTMESIQNGIGGSLIDKIFTFLTLAVAAPFLEEMLFRGIILKYLLKKQPPWKAILFSAIAFGVFHGNPWQFLYATIVGIFLGYMYWKTRSLFYSILIHFILNATSFFVATSEKSDINSSITKEITDANWQLILLFMFGLSIIYFAYNFFEKYFLSVNRSITLATQNAHKIVEIKKFLPKNIALENLNDIGFEGELRETGMTLDANARQKMRQIAVPYGVDTLADDTGLEVEALDGAPGVYSARYSGENATYESNVTKLLQEMNGKENRKAIFRTVMALSFGPEEKYFEGIINGTIATEPRGFNGFGYDSVFIPEGETRTFAEMTNDKKNEISHRFRALQKLKKYFEGKEVKGER